jgi:NAD(P)-dependent dehydrogenase (short-subunit alcohol dehydrogenase family)
MAKSVLITGANKSIGYEAARRLGALGYRVWLGSRDKGRGEAAAETLRAGGADVRVIDIEVTDDASVKAAAARVQKEDGKLDVLINNAGIPGDRSAPSEQSVDSVKVVYETNVYGPIRVTQAFLPLLKAAGQANIVMVSSGLGSLSKHSNPVDQFHGINILGYDTSKTALNAVTVAFAKELKDSGIKVNAVDPGYTDTDFNNHSGPRTVQQGADVLVKMATIDASGPTGGYFDDDGVIGW